jgi:hypothetical protein
MLTGNYNSMNNKGNIKISFLMIVLLSGCSFLDPDEELDYNKRIIIKSIDMGNSKKVEWYHYSLITSYSPGFIEINVDQKRELIMESSYISDISMSGDTLEITTWGTMHHGLDTINDHNIYFKFDTTGRQPMF